MLERWGWRYALFALGSWIFAPEVRRLVDYGSHFTALSVIQIIPLLLMLPFAWWMIREGWRQTNTTLRAFVAIWFAVFTYGFFVAAAHGSVASGLFGLAQFCLPASMAMWFAMRPEGAEQTYQRVAAFLLACAAVSSVYGIIQYISPPPWDVQWQMNLDAQSFGQPLPFQIRVYSTLNSPGPFGTFLATTMIMALPLLRGRKTWVAIALTLCVAALSLSLVRSAWLALALATVVYALLAPQRVRLLAALTGLTLLVIVGASLLFALAPSDDARETLSTRFQTLFDLQYDGSLADRQQTTADAVRDAMASPFGAGLGTTGVSAQLNANNGNLGTGLIDNGFASRFVELGYFGMLGFIVVIVGAPLATLGAWRMATLRKMPEATAMLASIIAMQVALLAFELSGDSYEGLIGVVFWTALSLATRWAIEVPKVQRASVALRNVTA